MELVNLIRPALQQVFVRQKDKDFCVFRIAAVRWHRCTFCRPSCFSTARKHIILSLQKFPLLFSRLKVSRTVMLLVIWKYWSVVFAFAQLEEIKAGMIFLLSFVLSVYLPFAFCSDDGGGWRKVVGKTVGSLSVLCPIWCLDGREIVLAVFRYCGLWFLFLFGFFLLTKT